MKKSTLEAIIERLMEKIEQLQVENSRITEINFDLYGTNDDLHKQIYNLEQEITQARETIKHRQYATFDDLKVLLSSPASPIHKIKIIRQITNCGLREAKDFHDNYFKGKTMQPIAQDAPAKDLGEVLDRTFYNAE
jgi:ribosomal protein L7/L12